MKTETPLSSSDKSQLDHLLNRFSETQLSQLNVYINDYIWKRRFKQFIQTIATGTSKTASPRNKRRP
ncbi:hypothetical protein HNQ91_000697 [Filimonas zeae]|nr:hypothetical protein [Filimonas zeae]